MAGTAAGMLFLPQLVRILLEEFKFRGAILVLAGLALHAAFGSTLLQPAKWHLKEEIIDIEAAPQTLETLKEDENDELPEMTNLLFPPANGRQMRKNFSEVAISSMNKGMTKRPTFPRIMSNGSNMAANGVLSNSELSTSIRRRKASVMSQLSALDFMGSNLLVHVNVSLQCFQTIYSVKYSQSNFEFIFRLVMRKPKKRIEQSKFAVSAQHLECPECKSKIISRNFGHQWIALAPSQIWTLAESISHRRRRQVFGDDSLNLWMFHF